MIVGRFFVTMYKKTKSLRTFDWKPLAKKRDMK